MKFEEVKEKIMGYLNGKGIAFEDEKNPLYMQGGMMLLKGDNFTVSVINFYPESKVQLIYKATTLAEVAIFAKMGEELKQHLGATEEWITMTSSSRPDDRRCGMGVYLLVR